jgi:hypothetical protein
MQVHTPRRLTSLTRSNCSAVSSAASTGWGLDAGVVERHVQPAEGTHCAVDHRRHLGFVGHVTCHPDCLMPGGPQFLGRRK